MGECALQFQISQEQVDGTYAFIGTKDVLVKGSQCKTTLTTPQLVQSFLFNTQSDKAIITKEIGQSHFLQNINYPPVSRVALIASQEINSDSTFSILGYVCKQLQLQWSDGSRYDIYYTKEISLTVNTFEFAFKEVPGLVLSYTISSAAGNRIKYVANKIDVSPLSLSLFTINKDLFQTID